MKKIFNLLRLGLKNPRYYIEAINVPWRYINFVALLSILMMTFSMFISIIPTFSRIASDFQAASDYVPDFIIRDGQLELSDDAKPLYYQSDSLKIVIDDSISTTTEYKSGISNEQKAMLEQSSAIGIYLLDDYSFITIGQTINEIPAYEYLFANSHRFGLFLDYIAEESFSINSVLFFVLFFSSAIIYLFQILFISILAGFFNIRLTRAITFKSRVKLTIIISFVPLVLLELISILIPGFIVTQFTLSVITLFILYLAFKNHTQFIHTIMNNLEEIDLDKLDEENKGNEDQKEDVEDDHDSDNDSSSQN